MVAMVRGSNLGPRFGSGVLGHSSRRMPRVVDFSRARSCTMAIPAAAAGDPLDCPGSAELKTTENAIHDQKPLTPACGGCGRSVSVAALEELLTNSYLVAWELDCEACGWLGGLVARNMGELLTLFRCKTVPEMAGGFADAIDGSEESWVEFSEERQTYLFGYSRYEATLDFPADPVALMSTITDFDDWFIEAAEAAEAAEDDDECTCE